MRGWMGLALWGALAAAPAGASTDLAQKNACMSCHAVAKKYAGQKDAAATLAKSIKSGGAGKWGPVPMPSQPGLSEADALTLANWVLAGAK